MIYKLFGWWYRWQACKCAARIIASRTDLEPRLIHSYAVFFEAYMIGGADDTVDYFGASVIELRDVTNENEARNYEEFLQKNWSPLAGYHHGLDRCL